MSDLPLRQPGRAFLSAYLSVLGFAALTAVLLPALAIVYAAIVGGNAPAPDGWDSEWVDWQGDGGWLAFDIVLAVVIYCLSVAAILAVTGFVLLLAAPPFIAVLLLLLGLADKLGPVGRWPWLWALLGVLATALPALASMRSEPWIGAWIAAAAALAGWRAGRTYFAEPFRSVPGTLPEPRDRHAS